MLLCVNPAVRGKRGSLVLPSFAKQGTGHFKKLNFSFIYAAG